MTFPNHLNINNEFKQIESSINKGYYRQAAASCGYTLEYVLSIIITHMKLEANLKQSEQIRMICEPLLKKHNHLFHLGCGELIGLLNRPNKTSKDVKPHQTTLIALMPNVFKRKIPDIHYINFSKMLSIRNKSVHPRKEMQGEFITREEAIEFRDELNRLVCCFSDFIKPLHMKKSRIKPQVKTMLASIIIVIIGSSLFLSGKYTNTMSHTFLTEEIDLCTRQKTN